MACFVVPAAEAEKHGGAHGTMEGMSFVNKLKWLTNMLWGGALLLLFEHVWHGEVVPFFPFLTAMESPASTAAMLWEMATTGLLMAGLITLVWVGMVLVTNAMEKNAGQAALQ